MITRLQSVLPERPVTPTPAPEVAEIVIVHYDAQDDVVYWCGYSNGSDGQGWTAERVEALEFASYRTAMSERAVAKRWHPKMRITLRRGQS